MSRVITESHVRQAARHGHLELPEGGIVTPAAQELAHTLGVALVRGRCGVGTGESGAIPAASAGLRIERSAPNSPVSNPHGSGKVAIGSDHGGFALKGALKPVLTELGWTIDDVGCHGTDAVDYPMFAARVAERVASGDARFGIMVDGAGIGSAMVANKISGVRAALCYDLTTAQNAREHNDANLLTLGGTLLGNRLAGEIVRTFLTTSFAGGRHQRRVAMIDALDKERSEN